METEGDIENGATSNNGYQIPFEDLQNQFGSINQQTKEDLLCEDLRLNVETLIENNPQAYDEDIEQEALLSKEEGPAPQYRQPQEPIETVTVTESGKSSNIFEGGIKKAGEQPPMEEFEKDCLQIIRENEDWEKLEEFAVDELDKSEGLSTKAYFYLGIALYK